MNSKNDGCAALIVLAVLVLPFIMIGCVRDNYHPEQIEGTVQNTFIKRFDDHDRYLVTIELENGSVETFQLRDTIFDGIDMRSADHFGRLKEGLKIKAKATGWRVPFFSTFRRLSYIRTVKESR